MKIETEWLRRGPKARTTKAKARIDSAQELIGQLKDVNAADADLERGDRLCRDRTADQAAG